MTRTLLTATDLADRWGISRARVHALRTEGKIPPGVQLTAGIVWRLAEIERHEAKTGRRPVDADGEEG